VGLDATTKGPSPLVGESKVSRESKVSCSENNYFAFLCVLHINCDEPGFGLRPARLTSHGAWRSAVYISSRALFTSLLLSLVFFIIPYCISKL
jgi:hypothetical protein